MKQVNIQTPLRMLVLLLGLFLSVGAFAQIDVKGHVKDAQGEPIIGATVRVVGTQTATVSDFDGNFVLKANQGADISVSYVGYQTQTVKAAANLDITLQEDANILDNVVVIGYGTVRKSDATGSVQSIEADQLGKGFATSPADLLQGKSAGVTITTNGGAPGAGSTIRIRGGSSLSASNDPLIVIDGLPISSTGISGSADVLSTINPNDIESFSILKDASATAIYGSRASNGVIVITTKKGTSGKPKITVDMNATVQTIAKKVDVLDSKGLYNFFVANYGDSENGMAALGATMDADGNIIGPNTNWQDEIYRTSFSYETNASVTGGYQNKSKSFKMPYRVSVGWLDNNGILKTSSMNRGTVGLNLTPTLLDDRLTINLNAKGVFTKNNFADEGAIGAAVKYIPTKTVYDENGNYTRWENNGSVNTMSVLNPVAQLNQQDKTSYVRRFVGNAQFDYKFKYVPGLRANLNLGLDISTSNGYNYSDYQSEISYHDKTQNGAGLYEKYTQLRRDQTLEFYLAYAKELPSIMSRFDVMAGYSWQHFYNKTTDFKQSNDGNNTEYATTPLFKTESFLVSFFGRLNYTFMDRYLLTATIRRDGTSRFQNNKWGVFPAVALAWRVNEENFLKNLSWLSNLKLRLGWGITGQQNIGQGDYPSIPTYHTNQAGSYYMFGNQTIVPISPMGYAAQLKWEETTTYNLGIDFGFMKNRINGSIDIYKRKTADLLNTIPVTTGTNLTDMLLMNVGDLENTGFEVAINAVPVQTKDWRWEVGLNFAYNKNEITKLTAYDDPSYIGVRTGGISGGVDNVVQLQSVGNPINSFWVYQQVYDQNGRPLDGVFVDRNADGAINDYDRYVYTKPDPDVTLGFNTEVNYKKWTLSASARANFNNYVYNNVASDGEMIADLWTNNFISNRVASAPFSNFSTARYISDYYVRNATFFKLDKVTLAYEIADWIRVHFTAQNVFTITNYDGLDPEVSGGIDNNMYPRPRTFLFGVSLNF
ncbi:MAG: TonB-dependent receptor [Prevotella sp.]|nr:TonB-dependent receptor [Prevotella sp.]MBQ9677571.1 TonB-dependent receptor [Prevotella sp.]